MNNSADIGSEATLPVTILTGFLGSGKTTMLARLLSDPRFARTAVIINEFGEIGLDHELLEQSREELVLLSNGCVCCTVRGDLVATLKRIHQQSGELTIDRVVVETTGLADPAPILHSLMADPSVTANFRVEYLVTTVDAFNGTQTLNDHPVAQSQVAMADRIVLTKLDLTDETTLSILKERLRLLNTVAPLHVAHHGEIDPALLFRDGSSLHDHVRSDPWLHGHESAEDHHDDDQHDHREHVHGEDHHHGMHDSGIRSYSIVRDEPISWSRFESWLEMIKAMRGTDLLRVKGIVNVLEHPEQPVVIHGVRPGVWTSGQAPTGAPDWFLSPAISSART